MKLEFLDFEFSEARKNTPAPAQTINANIDLTEVSAEKDALQVRFLYNVTYMPGSNFIRIGGKAKFSGSDATAALEDWKKTKRISGPAGEVIINAINYSASINAVFIARIFNLTPPIVPPVIKFGEPKATGKEKK